MNSNDKETLFFSLLRPIKIAILDAFYE